MGKNIDKNISKILSSKYSLKILDHAKKNLQHMHFLSSTTKRVIQKTAEAINDLIGNKIADAVRSAS